MFYSCLLLILGLCIFLFFISEVFHDQMQQFLDLPPKMLMPEFQLLDSMCIYLEMRSINRFMQSISISNESKAAAFCERLSIGIMEVAQTKRTSAYSKPPWIFKGRALYQLHLVKSETAKQFIPKEFRLVEAFGYTLGGFFLANYQDSPAGAFDELVVIAGLVWNPPTSCAWAARVLVSSDDACVHGRKEVGLPSHVAKFSKRTAAVIPKQQESKNNHFLNMIGLGTAHSKFEDRMDVQVTEISGLSATNICNINLPAAVSGPKVDRWMGPEIKMSLPSFSGLTEHNQNLLKYSCNIECRVRAVQPAKVSGPFSTATRDKEQTLGYRNCINEDSITGELLDNGQNSSIFVMLSKPILALEFNCLKMRVEAPTAVCDSSKSSCRTSLGVS